MAVNLRKNEKAMLAAWKDVCEDHSDTDWALFGYEANTNDLKLVSTGDGGLEELVDDFSSGKVMYAFCRVNDPNTNLPKNVLINWSGEAVPTSRKGACANHVRDVGNFFHGAHVTVNARDEDDVEPEAIMEKVAKSTSSKYPAFGKGSSQQQRIENQGPVGSVYKKTQAASEIKSSQKQREDFWAQQEKEEKARVAEEKKQATADRARLEKERLDRERREAEDREKKVKERDLMTRQQKKEEANIDKSMMQKERDIEKARWETIQKEEQQEDKTRRKRSESLTKAAEDSRLHITEPLSPSDKKGYGNWTAKPWTGQASAGGFRSVSFKPATPPSSPGPGEDFDQEYQNTVQQLIASRPQQTKHGRTFVLTGTKETRTTDGTQAELHRVVTTETTQKQTVETKLARNPYIDTTPIVQYNQPADISADLNNDDDDVEDPNLITEMVRKQSRLIHGKKKPTFLAKQVGMFEKPVEAEVNPFKVQLEAETRRSRPRILPGDGAPKAGFQPTCVVSTPVCHAPTPSHITPNKPAHKHPQAPPTQVTPQRPPAAANKTAPPRPAQPAVQSYLPRSTPHSHTEPKTTPSNVGHKPVAQPDAAKSQPVPMGSCLPKKPPAPSQAKSDPTGNQEDRKVDGVFESHPYTEEEDDGPPPNTALEAAALVAQRGDFNPRSMWQQHNVPPPLPSTRPSGPASPAKKKPVGYPLQPVPDMTSSAEAPPTEESRELPTNTALEAKALVSQRQNNPKDMWKDFHVPPPPPNLPLPPSPVKKPKTQEPRPKIVYEPAITEPLVQSCSWHASSLLGDTSFLISSTKDTTVPAAPPVQNGGPTHSTEQATLPDRPDGPPTNTAMEAASLVHQKGSFNPELARLKFDNKEASPNTALVGGRLLSGTTS
ncbi:DBNL [Branchiostoma lanceolatum]|uniref:DBNL protein n=1 Tax=Branchiostoma lanceolatum TaxID=7740 RepID=A0A8J9ZPV5_BRALA|nr:DBNL [Branchiostoma lanceolatum]